MLKSIKNPSDTKQSSERTQIEKETDDKFPSPLSQAQLNKKYERGVSFYKSNLSLRSISSSDSMIASDRSDFSTTPTLMSRTRSFSPLEVAVHKKNQDKNQVSISPVETDNSLTI